MTDTTTPSPGPAVLPEWAPWVLAALLLVLGLAVWEPYPPGIWHDDGVYVLLGRALAEGDGLRYVGVAGEPLAPKFPPLWPAVLALVWRAFPAFPDNAAALGAVNLVVLAGAGGLFAGYLRRALRLPLGLSLFVTLLAWLSPALWRVALVPLSEPVFLLCTVATLWAAARMEEREGAGPVLAFLACGALTVHARTLGVGVVAAGVLALALRRRFRAAAGAAAGTAALLLPWILWTRHAAATVPPTLQDTLGPYGSWWIGQAVRDPAGLAAFVADNAPQTLERVLTLLVPGVVGAPICLGLVLLPFLGLGLVEAWRRSPTLPLALGLSLAILLVWPFRNIRLLVPFHPLLVLPAVLGLAGALGLPGAGVPPGRRRASVRAAAGVVGACWFALAVAVSTWRLATGWPGEPYRIRSEALADAARAVSERTPPDAVVGAPELWSGLHLLTGRTVVPSARFLPLGGGPVWGTPRQQHELWEAAGVTHVLVEHGGRVHGEALDVLEAACPGSVQVVDLQPGRYLVRLDWDAACRARLPGGEAGP